MVNEILTVHFYNNWSTLTGDIISSALSRHDNLDFSTPFESLWESKRWSMSNWQSNLSSAFSRLLSNTLWTSVSA